MGTISFETKKADAMWAQLINEEIQACGNNVDAAAHGVVCRLVYDSDVIDLRKMIAAQALEAVNSLQIPVHSREA